MRPPAPSLPYADRLSSLPSCLSPLPTPLRRHGSPAELALLFHAYAAPLAPRPASSTAALAWAASTGKARSDTSLPSELRGVAPHGLHLLCDDFRLVSHLRCPVALLDGCTPPTPPPPPPTSAAPTPAALRANAAMLLITASPCS